MVSFGTGTDTGTEGLKSGRSNSLMNDLKSGRSDVLLNGLKMGVDWDVTFAFSISIARELAVV